MRPASPDIPAAEPSRVADRLSEPSPPADQPHNFFVLAAYQVVLRIGWIFKTESIVIPAFLDYITPPGTLRGLLRGCLPMLARLGQAVPPVLFARRMKLMRHKKAAMALSTLAMAVPFLTLSVIWAVQGGTDVGWLPWVFLALYGLFFVSTGLNQLAFNTLQGKLIAPTRRGRLASVATTVGAPAAIFAALTLMGPWLATEKRFDLIFGFTGVAFLLGAAGVLLLREPPDDYSEPRVRARDHFAAAWSLIRTNTNFRRLAVVAACYSTVLMMFPHYQALGRQRLGLDLTNLTMWVAVQNAGTFVFMFLAGPMSDRRGTRLVVQAAIFMSMLPPLLAMVLAMAGPEFGGYYWIVFVAIGSTPATIKIMNNYTLEIALASEHPRFLSTLALCIATPVLLFSPLIGVLISMTSFELVMGFAAAVIATGGLISLGLDEPRQAIPLEEMDSGMEEFED